MIARLSVYAKKALICSAVSSTWMRWPPLGYTHPKQVRALVPSGSKPMSTEQANHKVDATLFCVMRCCSDAFKFARLGWVGIVGPMHHSSRHSARLEKLLDCTFVPPQCLCIRLSAATSGEGTAMPDTYKLIASNWNIQALSSPQWITTHRSANVASIPRCARKGACSAGICKHYKLAPISTTKLLLFSCNNNVCFTDVLGLASFSPHFGFAELKQLGDSSNSPGLL